MTAERRGRSVPGLGPTGSVLAMPLALALLAPVVATPQGGAELDHARALIGSGAHAEAVRVLRDLVGQSPDDAEARILLGTALALLPRRSEAIAALEAAIRLQPDSARAHDALGMAYSRFVERDLARRAFEQAVKLDPEALRPRVHLALSLAELGEAEAALRHLRVVGAAEGDPDERAYARYVEGLIHAERGAHTEAATALEEAVTLDPSAAAALAQLGLARARLGDRAGAISALERSASLDPEDADVRRELGRQLLEADQADEAIHHLEAAVAAQPEDRRALYALVRALRVAGRTDEASEPQARLRELTGRTGQGDQATFEAGRINNAAIELEEAGRIADAVARYRAALDLDPLNTVFRRNLALALCRLGRWTECADELREVLRLDPDDEQATRALYMALEKAGGD